MDKGARWCGCVVTGIPREGDKGQGMDGPYHSGLRKCAQLLGFGVKDGEPASSARLGAFPSALRIKFRQSLIKKFPC